MVLAKMVDVGPKLKPHRESGRSPESRAKNSHTSHLTRHTQPSRVPPHTREQSGQNTAKSRSAIPTNNTAKILGNATPYRGHIPLHNPGKIRCEYKVPHFPITNLTTRRSLTARGAAPRKSTPLTLESRKRIKRKSPPHTPRTSAQSHNVILPV